MNARFPATVLLAAGMTLALTAGAQEAKPPADAAQLDCKEYAVFARRAAILRSLEAKLELVLRQIRDEAQAPYGLRSRALQREVARVYAEGLVPEEAGFQAFQRCTAVLGRFGPEV